MSTFFHHDPKRVDPGEIQRLHQQIEQLERCLAISSSRQRQLMATMSEIAWIANADGSMIDFNPRWYEYSGLGITESLAWGFLKAVHPEDRDRILCATEQTSTDQQSYSSNLRLLGATGTYQWFKAQATLVVAGGVVEWVGTYTAIAPQEYPAEINLSVDASQQKQAEAEKDQALVALRASDAKFRRVFESNMIGIVFWNVDGDISEANDAFLSIVGYKREDLQRGLNWLEMAPADQGFIDEQAIEQIKQSGICTPWEKEYIRCDGSRVAVLVGGAFLEGSQQEGVAFVFDLTERKRAEAAIKLRADELAKMAAVLAKTNAILEKRNQELDQFAYVTSHDLKAPLRAIANLSNWIEEDLEDVLTDETRHQMQLLRGRVHRMEKLINALLEYSRIGRVKNQIQRVNINDLLAEIIEAIAYTSASAYAPPQFTIEVEPNMPTIVTELLPLQQVFTNLISNAIKHHNREDGRVKISVQDEGTFYKFIVADDGVGIAPQFHEKIFVIFQTLQARDKVENTGVGLALVKKIVENQGGSISLESAEGQGSRFSFTWHK